MFSRSFLMLCNFEFTVRIGHKECTCITTTRIISSCILRAWLLYLYLVYLYMYMQDCISMIELLITNKCKHFSFLGPININSMYKTGELFNTNEISYKKIITSFCSWFGEKKITCTLIPLARDKNMAQIYLLSFNYHRLLVCHKAPYEFGIVVLPLSRRLQVRKSIIRCR